MLDSNRIETPLGTSTHWEPAREDALASVVERIWDFEGTLAHAAERTFPNGRLELVVQLDEPHRPGPGATPFPPLVIDGLRTTTDLVVAPGGRCRVLGIRLHPCGGAAFLEASLTELTDRTSNLQDLIGRSASELGERLHDARDGRARVTAAVRWARGRLARPREWDPLVARAVGSVERDGGTAAFADWEALTGRSRSRFAARFRDEVGVNPKRYARIIRFTRALERIRTTGDPLGAIAADTGFFDQAHFTTEFKAHAGMTPLAYRLARRYPDSDHLFE